MRYYITLNEERICIGYQTSDREIIADNVIEVTGAVTAGTVTPDWFLWRKYENGAWSQETYEPAPPPVPPVSLEDRIRVLEDALVELLLM